MEERTDTPQEEEINREFWNASKRFLKRDRSDETVVNQEELEICRERGHVVTHVSHQGWSQCSECKMWLREKRILEEREDEPPEDELDQLFYAERSLQVSKTTAERMKDLERMASRYRGRFASR